MFLDGQIDVGHHHPGRIFSSLTSGRDFFKLGQFGRQRLHEEVHVGVVLEHALLVALGRPLELGNEHEALVLYPRTLQLTLVILEDDVGIALRRLLVVVKPALLLLVDSTDELDLLTPLVLEVFVACHGRFFFCILLFFLLLEAQPACDRPTAID